MARISDVPQPIDPRDPNRVGNRRQQETTESQSSGASSQADSVNLSPDAKEAEALETALKAEIKNTADVREDRVADVKARLASGEFDPNSDETKRAVADALLNQMGV